MTLRKSPIKTQLLLVNMRVEAEDSRIRLVYSMCWHICGPGMSVDWAGQSIEPDGRYESHVRVQARQGWAATPAISHEGQNWGKDEQSPAAAPNKECQGKMGLAKWV